MGRRGGLSIDEAVLFIKLQDERKKIMLDIHKIERYLANPFEKKESSEERKRRYLKAVTKKNVLVKQVSAIDKEMIRLKKKSEGK